MASRGSKRSFWVAAALAVPAVVGACSSAAPAGHAGPPGPTTAVPAAAARWVISTIAGGPGGPAPGPRLAIIAPCAMSYAGGYLDLAGSRALEDQGTAATAAVTRLSTKAGVLQAVAGDGDTGLAANGTPALAARLGGAVRGVATDQHGNVALSDGDAFYQDVGAQGNERVRVVAARRGIFYGQAMRAGRIYTIAGSGPRGFAGDGGPARAARLYDPQASAVDAAGNVVFADVGNDRIRVIAARTGRYYGLAMRAGDIYTIAGGGPARPASAWLGGPALGAHLALEDSSAARQQPSTVRIDRHGNVLLGDTFGNRLLVVAARSGTFYGTSMTTGHIYSLAGNGTSVASVTSPVLTGPAAGVDLNEVSGLATDPSGNILIADQGGRHVGQKEVYYGLVRVLAARSGTGVLVSDGPRLRLIHLR
ncbi:MAG: hypothetical protein ACRDRJ_46260 [Streptosporangiaceae bacterium]